MEKTNKKGGPCLRQAGLNKIKSSAPELKSSQTFTIILPNLIHKSKKRNLT